MKRFLALGLMVGLAVMVSSSAAAPAAKDAEKTKEALRELQDFIGGWKGSGQTKLKPTSRDPSWDETVKWNWRFKGDKIWLAVAFEGGKFFKTAEIHYLLDTKKYQLIASPVAGKEKVTFEGALKDDKLTFERVDPKTKEVQRIIMNTAADGDRFVFKVESRNDGGTIWRFNYMVAATKIGVSLGSKEKKPECVVSGGLGTMTVSYGGATYYVCCSGCADAFKENPKKFVDEFLAKKKK
jgi:YHS domain